MTRLGGKSTAEATAMTDFKGEKERHGLPPSKSEKNNRESCNTREEQPIIDAR